MRFSAGWAASSSENEAGVRRRFETPDIWPGFVDLFAGFALVVVASVLAAQVVIEKKTQEALDQDQLLDGVVRQYVASHQPEDPTWSAIEVDTSEVGRVRIALPGQMTFGLGSSELKPAARRTLSRLAGLLETLKRRGAAKAYVIGFADTSRVLGILDDGSTNNLELSAHRATNTALYLIRERALGDTFVVVSAMGDKMPYLKDQHIDAANSRRIEIAVHYREPNWQGR